jgi:hypothetical protein
MNENLSDQIRERAHEKWVASGHRDGEAEQHWLAAEREILAAILAASLTAVPVKTSAKRRRSRATPKRQARAS